MVPNRADLAAVLAAIGEEAAAVAKDPVWSEAVLEDPEVLGVESLAADCVTVRVSTKTTPSQRASLARELRSRITRRLQRDGLVATEPSSSGSGSTTSPE
jgi:small conductance mechanosensitive channel